MLTKNLELFSMPKQQYPGLLICKQSGITVIATAYTQPTITQLYLHVDLNDLVFYTKLL